MCNIILRIPRSCICIPYRIQYLKILKTESWKWVGIIPTDGTTGLPNKTNAHTQKKLLFQDADLDHIALCDKQEAETVQIVAAPQGKVQQLHTWRCKMIFAT